MSPKLTDKKMGRGGKKQFMFPMWVGWQSEVVGLSPASQESRWQAVEDFLPVQALTDFSSTMFKWTPGTSLAFA